MSVPVRVAYSGQCPPSCIAVLSPVSTFKAGSLTIRQRIRSNDLRPLPASLRPAALGQSQDRQTSGRRRQIGGTGDFLIWVNVKLSCPAMFVVFVGGAACLAIPATLQDRSRHFSVEGYFMTIKETSTALFWIIAITIAALGVGTAFYLSPP